MAQVEVALLGQVEQPARGADDDVDARASAPRPAARRPGRRRWRGRGSRGVAAAFVEVVGDLHAQLAGRDDDEGLRLAGGHRHRRLARRLSSVGDDALQQRDAEAEGLAGAGLGLADDVVAAQRDREGQLLDREGVGDADGLEGLDGLGKDAELGEAQLDGACRDLDGASCRSPGRSSSASLVCRSVAAARVEVLRTDLVSWRGRVQDGALLVRVFCTHE